MVGDSCPSVLVPTPPKPAPDAAFARCERRPKGCSPMGQRYNRNMGARGFVGGVLLLAAAGSAAAKPGDLIDTLHNEDAPLTILDPAAAAPPCALKSGLCVTPGSRSTIAVASQPVASAAEPASVKP